MIHCKECCEHNFTVVRKTNKNRFTLSYNDITNKINSNSTYNVVLTELVKSTCAAVELNNTTMEKMDDNSNTDKLNSGINRQSSKGNTSEKSGKGTEGMNDKSRNNNANGNMAFSLLKVKEEKINLASVIAYKTSQDRAAEALGLDETGYDNAKEAIAVKDGSDGGMHDITTHKVTPTKTSYKRGDNKTEQDLKDEEDRKTNDVIDLNSDSDVDIYDAEDIDLDKADLEDTNEGYSMEISTPDNKRPGSTRNVPQGIRWQQRNLQNRNKEVYGKMGRGGARPGKGQRVTFHRGSPKSSNQQSTLQTFMKSTETQQHVFKGAPKQQKPNVEDIDSDSSMEKIEQKGDKVKQQETSKWYTAKSDGKATFNNEKPEQSKPFKLFGRSNSFEQKKNNNPYAKAKQTSLGQAAKASLNTVAKQTENDKGKVTAKNTRATSKTTNNASVSFANTHMSQTAKQTPIQEYAKAVIGKKRSELQHSVRLKFNFKCEGTTQYKTIVSNLLRSAQLVEDGAMVLPWKDDKDVGPLSKDDLLMQINDREYIKYLHMDQANREAGFNNRKTYYNIGIRFTSNLTPTQFKDSWDLKKQQMKQDQNLTYQAVYMAESQTHPESYLIGFAAGSTEGISTEGMDAKLTEILGIDISSNYQKFHQWGITNDIWKLAGDQAKNTGFSENTAGYNRVKYKWAPDGLCFFVHTQEDVRKARLTMCKNFGLQSTKVESFPGGGRMRFIPLKGSAQLSERAHEIIKQCVRWHVWQKVNEVELVTKFINVHDTIPAFEGRTFEEIVISMQNEKGKHLFRHFKKAWNKDPLQDYWNISVHTKMLEEATVAFSQLIPALVEQYGDEMDKFIRTAGTVRRRAGRYNTQSNEEDEWFNTSDFMNDEEKEFIFEGFEAIFGASVNTSSTKVEVVGDESPQAPDATSWSDLNCEASAMTTITQQTEKVTDSTDGATPISSITSHSNLPQDEHEIEMRKERIRLRLKSTHGMQNQYITQALEGIKEFGMIPSMISIEKTTYNETQIVAFIVSIDKEMRRAFGSNTEMTSVNTDLIQETDQGTETPRTELKNTAIGRHADIGQGKQSEPSRNDQ